jgi:hypothetical protein
MLSVGISLSLFALHNAESCKYPLTKMSFYRDNIAFARCSSTEDCFEFNGYF